jgi:hypothetical protein
MTKTLLAAAGLASMTAVALAASELVAVEALIKIQHDRVDRVPGEPSAFFELPRNLAEKMRDDGILRILDVVDTSQLVQPAAAADMAVVGGGTGALTTLADVGDFINQDELFKVLQAEHAELSIALQTERDVSCNLTLAHQAEQAKTAELTQALAAANEQLVEVQKQLEAAQATFVLSPGTTALAGDQALGDVVGDAAGGDVKGADDVGLGDAGGDKAGGDAQVDTASTNTAADTSAKGKGAKATKA